MSNPGKSASDQPEAEKLDKGTKELLRLRDEKYKEWEDAQQGEIDSQTRFDKRQREMQQAADKNRGS